MNNLKILEDCLNWNLRMYGMCEEQLNKCEELYKEAKKAQEIRRARIKQLHEQILEAQNAHP